MLKKRILTGLALLACFFASLFAPWNVFPAILVLVLTIGAWEWASLADLKRPLERIAFVTTILLAMISIAYFKDQLVAVVFNLALIVFWFWILLLPLLYKFPTTESLFRKKVIAVAMGAMILISTAAGLLWLKMQDNGPWLVLVLICVVSIADSGAYFAGKAWGKNPLAPSISPGKTFEGFYGGLVANFLFAFVLSLILGLSPEKSLLLVLVVLSTSLLSVEGDLLESAIKRARGVKDSGHILPGHGGVLDRIDGICAATPCFVFGILLAGV